MAAQPSFSASVPAPPVTLRLVDAPATPPSREPEWVGRSWEATKREIRRYMRTAWAFGTAPRETARLWADGRFDALNPIAYLLNTLAILGSWRAVWQRLLHLPDAPLSMDVAYAAGPFVGMIVIGSTLHVLCRLFGSTRRIQSTWATSIYSTSGLPSVFHLIATPFSLLSTTLKTPEQMQAHLSVFLVPMICGYAIMYWQTMALAGLHGLKPWRVFLIQILGTICLLALCVAFVNELGVGLRLLHRLRHLRH